MRVGVQQLEAMSTCKDSWSSAATSLALGMLVICQLLITV